MSIAGDLIRGNTDTIILARLMLRDSYGCLLYTSFPEKVGSATDSMGITWPVRGLRICSSLAGPENMRENQFSFFIA